MMQDPLPPRQTDLWVVSHRLEAEAGHAPGEGGGVICFTPGTQILTPDGLRPGRGAARGRPRPDQGRRPGRDPLAREPGALSGARLHVMPHLAPIRLREGALDRGVPDAGLLVSPDHRLVLRGARARALFGQDEVLVAARDLVNDRTVLVERGLREVTYIHLDAARATPSSSPTPWRPSASTPRAPRSPRSTRPTARGCSPGCPTRGGRRRLRALRAAGAGAQRGRDPRAMAVAGAGGAGRVDIAPPACAKRRAWCWRAPRGDPCRPVREEDNALQPPAAARGRIEGDQRVTKRTAAKYKIDRRMGENIWGRPKSPVNKREYGPGQHGQRRKNKMSDFGTQLRAKQKLKGYYGDLTEKQFKRIYADAARVKGDTGENLVGLLERRLDAVVYRAKFVPTIFAARQFVNHAHVLVNGKSVNIPSYRVKEGDVIAVREKSRAARH